MRSSIVAVPGEPCVSAGVFMSKILSRAEEGGQGLRSQTLAPEGAPASAGAAPPAPQDSQPMRGQLGRAGDAAGLRRGPLRGRPRTGRLPTARRIAGRLSGARQLLAPVRAGLPGGIACLAGAVIPSRRRSRPRPPARERREPERHHLRPFTGHPVEPAEDLGSFFGRFALVQTWRGRHLVPVRAMPRPGPAAGPLVLAL